MEILEKLLLVKEMIIQLVACQIIHTCKMIAVDLSKQQELDADPRKIQEINFTANLDRDRNTTIFFIIKQEKETKFEFSQGTVKML